MFTARPLSCNLRLFSQLICISQLGTAVAAAGSIEPFCHRFADSLHCELCDSTCIGYRELVLVIDNAGRRSLTERYRSASDPQRTTEDKARFAFKSNTEAEMFDRSMSGSYVISRTRYLCTSCLDPRPRDSTDPGTRLGASGIASFNKATSRSEELWLGRLG